MSSRWTSRKFLTTVAAQVAALVVLLWPGHDQAVTEGTQAVVALLVLFLSALGYNLAEASIDRAGTAQPGSSQPGDADMPEDESKRQE